METSEQLDGRRNNAPLSAPTSGGASAARGEADPDGNAGAGATANRGAAGGAFREANAVGEDGDFEMAGETELRERFLAAIDGQNEEYLARIKELEAAYYLRTKHDPDDCQIVMMRKVNDGQLYLETAHIRPLKGDDDLYRDYKAVKARLVKACSLLGSFGGGHAEVTQFLRDTQV